MSSATASADCISGNCVNGNGTYIYANGDRYVGTFVNSALEEGTYVWTNGDEYSGTFATNGFFTGSGGYLWADGRSRLAFHRRDYSALSVSTFRAGVPFTREQAEKKELLNGGKYLNPVKIKPLEYASVSGTRYKKTAERGFGKIAFFLGLFGLVWLIKYLFKQGSEVYQNNSFNKQKQGTQTQEIANPKDAKPQNDFVNEVASTIQPPPKQPINQAAKPLIDEKQKLLNERKGRILTKPPYIVQDAMKLFFREHQGSKSSSTTFGVEESPLACFGYRVGKTSGRPVAQRREILNYAIWGEIPDFFSVYYRNSWGKPGTHKRYNKILNHLNMLVEKRADRKTFETAISHWTMDISWLKKNNGNLMNKLRRIKH